MSNGDATNATRVADFHVALGVTPPAAPCVPDEATLAIKKKLIEEEYAEVMEAFGALASAETPDLPASITPVLHELADLLYVTYGAMIAFGVDADAIFAEVHRANMQKMGGPRRADGKQLKPPGWQPADVASVIATMQP